MEEYINQATASLDKIHCYISSILLQSNKLNLFYEIGVFMSSVDFSPFQHAYVCPVNPETHWVLKALSDGKSVDILVDLKGETHEKLTPSQITQLTNFITVLRRGLLPSPFKEARSSVLQTPLVLLNAEKLDSRFVEKLSCVTEHLKHAAVTLLQEGDELPKLAVFSTSSPKALDSITYQAKKIFKTNASKLTGGQFITQILSFEIGAEISLKQKNEINTHIFNTAQQTLSKIHKTSIGVLRSGGGAGTSSSSSLGTELVRLNTKQLLDQFPLAKRAKQLPFPVIDMLKRVCPEFQKLSVMQLLELAIFSVIEKPQESSSSTALHPISNSSSTTQSVEAFAIAQGATKLSLEEGLPYFGQALALLQEGGINATIPTLLNMCLKGGHRNNIPQEFIKAMLAYFNNEIAANGNKLGYRLNEGVLKSLSTPICDLVKAQGPSRTLISTFMGQLQRVTDLLLRVPEHLLAKQEQCEASFKDEMMRLMENSAEKMGWATDKVAFARGCIEELTADQSTQLNIYQDAQRTTAKKILAPSLELIPWAKINRLKSQNNEEWVACWAEKNLQDLQELRNHAELAFEITKWYGGLFEELRYQFLSLMCYLCSPDRDVIDPDLSPKTFVKEVVQKNGFISQHLGRNLPPDLEKSHSVLLNSSAPTKNLMCLLAFSKASTGLVASFINSIESFITTRRNNKELLQQTMATCVSKPRGSRPQRGGGKKRGAAPSVARQSKPSQRVSKETVTSVPPLLDEPSLKRVLSGDPLATLHDQMLEGLKSHRNSFKNMYAIQCWDNAVELYRDLFCELLDRPNETDSQQVADYVNRIVVLLNQLMEQVVSSHALESAEPKNLFERQRVVSHNILKMLNNHDLATKVPTLRDAAEAVNGLEMLARNLKAHEPKDSEGARLLYQADTLALQQSVTSSSSSSGSTLDADRLLHQTQTLVINQLAVLGNIVGCSADLDPIREISTYREPPAFDVAGLIDKIGELIGKMEACIQRGAVTSPSSAPLHQGYLTDAIRLLGLMKGRLKRHSENGNVRNFFKMLATTMALTLEFTALTVSGKLGKRDLSQMRWHHFSHNVTNLFEELGFYALSSKEEDLLDASDRVHNLTRYSANYEKIKRNHSSQDLYLQLIKRLHPADATTQGGVGATSWQSADRNLRATVKDAVGDMYDRLKTGLGLLDKLISLHP